MERIGLIAGGGGLPVIFAKEARRRGVRIIGFAIKELTSPSLDNVCDRVHWFNTDQIKKFFMLLLMERIKKIVMLGKVDKSIIYNGMKKGEEELNALKGTEDKKDYAILDKVTAELTKRGIKVADGIEYLSDLLLPKGILTKRYPSQSENEDILFGFETAKALARLDIGQTIVVKDKTVISVEAMEGTNQTIDRAAKICGNGFVVVKVSRPQQDMRWDVPVVGPETVEVIVRNKGSVLVLEEKRMFLLEKETCKKIADKNNISIVIA